MPVIEKSNPLCTDKSKLEIGLLTSLNFCQVIANALVWAFQYLSLIDIDDSTVHMVMKLRKMNLD